MYQAALVPEARSVDRDACWWLGLPGDRRRSPAVPIVIGEESGTDAASVARQTKKAKSTDLAVHTLYLADFPIERGELTGSGFGLIAPTPGGTIGAVSIAPTRVTGFEVGDVVIGTAKPSYKTLTSLLPLSGTVMSAEHPGPDAFTDISGQVTVLHLSEDVICLDMSFEVRNGLSAVAAVQGVVAAPVLRSGDSFFLR